MSPTRKRSPALVALTASALAALTGGRAQAQAADAGAAPQVDYRYSFYREDALPADQVAAGDGERYEISTHQLRFTQPAGDATVLGADLAFEAMSGASPRFVQPDASGRPIQVMSGASIEDQRGDALLRVTRRKAGTAATFAAGYSGENDYAALNGAVELEHALDDTVTTLSASVGYSSDTLEPTQGATPTGTLHDRRSAATGRVGYARVLGPVTAVQTSVSYTLHDGYLADPYKEAWIVSAADTVPDTRPGRRAQLAWLTRLRHFFKGPDAALHLDYRYYHDDWEVDAHTVELAWHQHVGGSVRVAPNLRYYSQSQAYFYAPFYQAPRADGLAASDYRLAPYGAIDAGVTVSWSTGDWHTSLRYERYASDADYALGAVAVENPGLVDFQVVSLGVKKTF